MATAARHRAPTRGVTAPNGRIAWIDTARGIAIILVVLLHATEWLGEIGLRSGGWYGINEIVGTLRMPLFFMAAGLLGAGWLKRAWPQVLSGKVLFLFWAYLMWQPIESLAAIAAAQFQDSDITPFRMAVSLGLSPVRPRFTLWFLWALALYFVVSRVLQKRWLPAQFAVAGAVSAYWLSKDIVTGNLGYDGVAKYYVFFLIGLHYKDALLAFAERLTVMTSLACIGVWGVLVTGAWVAGLTHVVGVGLVMRLLGLVGGIALSVRLAPVSIFRYLGSRTLQIYLAHVSFLILLTWALSGVRDADWLAPVIPVLGPVITVPVIAAGLLLYAIARGPLRYFYVPPSAVVALVRRVMTRRVPVAHTELPPLPPALIDLRDLDVRDRRLAPDQA